MIEYHIRAIRKASATRDMVKKARHTTSNGAFRRVSKKLLREFSQQRPIRTGPLVISVLGDAIAPRGGSVWLGSLIEALAAFGISDRLVRTSVSRLAKQDWLVAERIGRRSFYQLTDRGLSRFREASRRIYAEPRHDWDGKWCLALIAGAAADARDELRRELGWLGFAPFSSNVLAHPAPDLRAVEACLADIEGGNRVLLMDAEAHENRAWYLRSLVSEAWQLDELGARYKSFLERFQPVYAAARDCSSVDADAAFFVRVLLIHEYRRVLLRDPSLPESLLPEHWSGHQAFQLCRNLYALLAAPAERFISAQFENAYGPLPEADAWFYRRFGELPGAADAASALSNS